MQGQTDSLFPLGQADAAARAVRANGAPVDVDWLAGGHDGGDPETDRLHARVRAWFDRYLKGDKSADTGPAFRVTRTGGVDSTDGRAQLRGASADAYPGLRGGTRTVELTGREQRFANPAGASPPAVSALPGIGGLGGLSQLSSLGIGVSLDFPGQHARFESAPVTRDLRITGSPAVTVRVTSTSDDAVLFAKVYDVGPDGRQQVLPSQLVTPVRVEGARAGKDVTLTLPAVDHEVRRATGCAWSSPPPTSRTRPRPPRRRTPWRCGATSPCPPRPASPPPRPRCPPGWCGCPSPAPCSPSRCCSPAAAAPPPRPPTRSWPAGAPPDHRTEQALRPLHRPVRRTGPVVPCGEGPGARPARTQRRRQDHHPAHADGAHQARRRRDPRLRPRHPPRRARAVPGRRLRRGCGLPAAPVRPGEPRAVLGRHRPPARGRPPRRGTGDRRSRRRARPRRAHLLAGHAPAPRHRPGHAGPARPADPRRTHQRPRPAADPRDARGDDPVRGRRTHGDRLQPSAGGGRAVLHAPRRHGPRPPGPGRAGARHHRLRRHPPRRHRRPRRGAPRREGRSPARRGDRRPHRRGAAGPARRRRHRPPG